MAKTDPSPRQREIVDAVAEHRSVAASDHAARRITTEAYIAQPVRLNTELDALAVSPAPSSTLSDGDAIVRFLRDLNAAWAEVGEWERAKLVASVYDRIAVNDKEVVEVEFTDDAKRHGLAWALPEQVVVVMARPAGARRRQSTIVRVPIHGKAEWLAATCKRSAS